MPFRWWGRVRCPDLGADEVFHTYSAFARGLDHSAPGYPFLDLTPYGRQEKWEDSPAGWPQGVDAVGVPMDEQ
jgi:predicted dithiol-disulfide oxidoreductase (DUF899 family)